MLSPFLISVREGLEMAIIVAIVLAYLAKTGNRDRFKYVWIGLAGALMTSVGAAAVIFMVAGELEGQAATIFEGVTMLMAVAILTWMIFWMRKVSRHLKRELENKVGAALEIGSSAGLASLVFVAVVREGLEEAFFMFSASRTSSAAQSIAGALLGLGVATALGYAVYSGSRWLNLRTFFNATSVILILVAAGLLAHALGEFMELGLVPPIIEHVWNSNGVLNEKSAVGAFFRTLFGYNADPSLLEVVVYFIYIIVSMFAFVRPMMSSRMENTAGTPRTI